MAIITKVKPIFCFFHQIIKIPLWFIVPCGVIVTICMNSLEEFFFIPLMYIFIHTIGRVMDVQSNGMSDQCVLVLSIIGILIYPVILWLFLVLLKKLIYKRTTFTFDEKGITYTVNFLIFHQKHVNYSDIKEINFNQGPLQRLFGLATIKITTHATTPNAGMEIYNIQNYREVYSLLMAQTGHQY